jgi:polyhydroxybutyrate depolymerase
MQMARSVRARVPGFSGAALLVAWLMVPTAACTPSVGSGANGATGGRSGTGGGAGGTTMRGGNGGSASGGGGGEARTGGTSGGGGAGPAGGTGGTTVTGGGGSASTGSGGTSGGGTSGGRNDAGDAGFGTEAGNDAATGDGGLAPAQPSAGCGKPADQALATYIRKTAKAEVRGQTRVYDLYLPAGYNPQRAYRTIFLGHGCDGSIPYPMQEASKGDAILVALRATASQTRFGGGCFDTMPKDSLEIPYFDQILSDVSTDYCVDKARVFIAGHSSGSYLSYLIGCARAGVVRGEGNTAGALPPGAPTCGGPIAALMGHDTRDQFNSYAGGEAARDRILMTNGCSKETVPYDWDGNPSTPSPCVSYLGCKPGYPVVWCSTTGQGAPPAYHPDMIPITTVGLWRFWSQF